MGVDDRTNSGTLLDGSHGHDKRAAWSPPELHAGALASPCRLRMTRMFECRGSVAPWRRWFPSCLAPFSFCCTPQPATKFRSRREGARSRLLSSGITVTVTWICTERLSTGTHVQCLLSVRGQIARTNQVAPARLRHVALRSPETGDRRCLHRLAPHVRPGTDPDAIHITMPCRTHSSLPRGRFPFRPCFSLSRDVRVVSRECPNWTKCGFIAVPTRTVWNGIEDTRIVHGQVRRSRPIRIGGLGQSV
jgi:hypothetical protein